MERMIKFILGAVLGGAVGSGVALLLAPKTGQNLRSDFADYAASVKQEVRRAAQQRRVELSNELERLREPETIHQA